MIVRDNTKIHLKQGLTKTFAKFTLGRSSIFIGGGRYLNGPAKPTGEARSAQIGSVIKLKLVFIVRAEFLTLLRPSEQGRWHVQAKLHTTMQCFQISSTIERE